MKSLLKLLSLLLFTCLINPSGLQGALTPFTSQAYTQPVMENLPIFNHFVWQYPFIPYFFLTLGFLIIAGGFLIIKKDLKNHLAAGGLAVLLSLGSFIAIRLMGPYAYFWIPLAGYGWWLWMATWPQRFKNIIENILLTFSIIIGLSFYCDWNQIKYLGPINSCDAAASFFINNDLKGPIFSGYNIGGYLIFHLSPKHKVFLDNRPEAYPKKFNDDIYFPMRSNEQYWHKMDQKYQFNVIFDMLERTEAGMNFIKARLNDPQWALVFFSGQTYIFLKQNQQNSNIIRQYRTYAQFQ